MVDKKMILMPTSGNPSAFRNEFIARCHLRQKEVISRAHRAVVAHSDESVGATRAACMQILLSLCASFSVLFCGPSSSKLRTGHQMARSCHPALSLLFARCPPWPRRGSLPSPRTYAGRALLISEALM